MLHAPSPMLGIARDSCLLGAPSLGLRVWLRSRLQEGNVQSVLGEGTAWVTSWRWEGPGYAYRHVDEYSD